MCAVGRQQSFEDLLGGHADLFCDGDGGEVFGIDFVLAKLEGNAERFKEARAVGLHCVGLPGSRSDAAGVQGDDEVGDGGGKLALMRGEDDGAVGLAEAGEERDHLADAFDIHVGERLVEQEQLGNGEQNAGERGALAHALRVLAEEAIEIGIEADLAERFSGREAGAAGIETAEVAEIFLRGELVVEHGRVAHVADAGARVVGLGVAEDVDRAVRGTKKAGENAQQRGFAGAVFAEENVAAAGLEIERDLAESGKGAEKLGHLIEPGAEG